MKRILVYTGKDFYWKSGTIMSSIYELVQGGEYKRFDWGFLESALSKGEEFIIRQANEQEQRMFQKHLKEITKKGP